MCHRTDQLAAVLHDDLRRIALERMAENIIGGEEKPCIAAALDHLLGRADRERVRVEHPLHRVGRTKFAVEICRAGRMGDKELFAVVGDLLNRQAYRRDRNVDDQIDLVDIVPFAALCPRQCPA